MLMLQRLDDPSNIGKMDVANWMDDYVDVNNIPWRAVTTVQRKISFVLLH